MSEHLFSSVNQFAMMKRQFVVDEYADDLMVGMMIIFMPEGILFEGSWLDNISRD